MADKKTTLVMFSYDDGSSEYAEGEHAEEVMQWLSGCQAMQCIHGGQYTGRKMIVGDLAAAKAVLEDLKAGG